MRLPLTALFSGLVFATGCVEEDAAMFIKGALPLVPDACAVSNADNVFLPSGILDLNARRGYSTFLKVLTNLPATFNNQDVTQDQTRSPNYPDYGAVDNNVVIFETASIDFELVGAVEPTGFLAGASGGALTCTGGVCTSNANNEAGKREEVPAAGTVFNPQTTLNSAEVVVTEALSGSTANALLNTFTEAAKAATLLDADGNLIANSQQGILANNLLVVPGQKQRLTVNISLTGTTTGSGDLRLVKSAIFPFGIDVCIGCLKPDDDFCRKFGARAFDIAADGSLLAPGEEGERAANCIDGQDIPTAVCVCGSQANAAAPFVPDGRIVTNDSEICLSPP